MKAYELLEVMKGSPQWIDEGADGKAEFWVPESFGGGMLWIGRWRGRSPWELHPDSDELLHVLEGEVVVTVLTDGQPVRETLRAGSVLVVPRGAWHRQEARLEVVQYGVTPGRTEHSSADDPRG